MKRKKLKIDELTVKSFVTSFDASNARTVKGGFTGGGNLCSNVICQSDGCPATNDTCPEGGSGTTGEFGCVGESGPPCESDGAGPCVTNVQGC